MNYENLINIPSMYCSNCIPFYSLINPSTKVLGQKMKRHTLRKQLDSMRNDDGYKKYTHEKVLSKTI